MIRITAERSGPPVDRTAQGLWRIPFPVNAKPAGSRQSAGEQELPCLTARFALFPALCYIFHCKTKGFHHRHTWGNSSKPPLRVAGFEHTILPGQTNALELEGTTDPDQTGQTYPSPFCRLPRSPKPGRTPARPSACQPRSWRRDRDRAGQAQ